MVGFAMPNARFSGDRSESAAMKSWALGVQTVEKQMGAQPQYAQPLISSGLHILHARRSQTWRRGYLEWHVLHRRFRHSTFSSPGSSSGVQIVRQLMTDVST
jgi:hypothetical protein